MAVVQRNCIVCSEPFDSKNSRGVYCSAACKSSDHRRKKRADKTITIGRLEVTFTDVGDTKSYEELEALVRSFLNPEVLEAIHSDAPIILMRETQ